jgi:hypothetical protein
MVDDEVANLDPSALHETIKAKYLRSAAPSVTSEMGTEPLHGADWYSGGQSMAQKDRSSSDEHREHLISPSEDYDLVITPAGALPRDKVHAVGPNEVVRRNPDGTYTVVQKAGPTDPENDRGLRQSES